ncbi:sigma-54-dependent Fis family transcriptional regulator [Fulvivirga sp. RKSG066]|uniref:sigma-54-dependent transcriptional regulator n=1 Tax=Fulvivirga aurantia TaxID=2529383 RepID=UPI0012BB9C04|nr:sigma-54 dependent transcriptional regulator [Fulvivirga aurantia]MTI21380.1 sigma-54-dependent Fis family transcriptional regulator [Fulvivirga aurantia]
MQKTQANILVIDDDRDVLHSAKIVLKPVFSKIITESNPEQLSYLISNNQYDVILLDMNYTAGATSGKEGLFWLKRIIDTIPDQQVVMMTAYGDLKLAVEAMKVGAADFIVKPWENEKFQATILSAFNHSQSKKELSTLKHKQNQMKEMLTQADHDIVGSSVAMKEIFYTIDKVSETDANILILGENGTGKELVAKAIHQRSKRADEVFVKVDLGSISHSLFESELFGHKKGAFTDAKEDRVGRFVMADGGTLFLDEIGNLSLEMQAKLLSAIQSKSITPVGSDKSHKTDCRIIAATNENIHQMIAEKKFREDLLYRINTVEVVVPPLRERLEDISLLANHYLSIFNQKYRKALSINDDAIEFLKQHSWPGNVRELQHAIERAVIMAEDVVLRPTDFLLKPSGIKQKQDTLKLEEIEKETIEEAIKQHQGNMSKAAKALGLGRTTLYRKMEKYGIK